MIHTDICQRNPCYKPLVRTVFEKLDPWAMLVIRRSSFVVVIDQLAQCHFELAREVCEIKRHKDGRQATELLNNVSIHSASAWRVATLIMVQADRRLNQHLIEHLCLTRGPKPDFFPNLVRVEVATGVEIFDALQILTGKSFHGGRVKSRLARFGLQFTNGWQLTCLDSPVTAFQDHRKRPGSTCIAVFELDP